MGWILSNMLAKEHISRFRLAGGIGICSWPVDAMMRCTWAARENLETYLGTYTRAK